MTRTQVALSLMLSPHPSHPPLDWAVSGGWAITNTFEHYRDGLHPRLLSVPADPDRLATALLERIEVAEVGSYEPLPTLGRELAQVADAVLDQVRS